MNDLTIEQLAPGIKIYDLKLKRFREIEYIQGNKIKFKKQALLVNFNKERFKLESK